MPFATVGWTDGRTHDDSSEHIYRASLASRGKTDENYVFDTIKISN